MEISIHTLLIIQIIEYFDIESKYTARNGWKCLTKTSTTVSLILPFVVKGKVMDFITI